MSAARWRALALAAGLLLLLAAACITPPPPRPTSPPRTPTQDRSVPFGEPEWISKPGSQPTVTPVPLPTTTVAGLKVELLHQGLIFPHSLAFAPDGRLFFVEVKELRGNEFYGKVRVVVNGKLQEWAVWEDRVGAGNEQGMVGLALDPDFATNHYLYVYYTSGKSGASAPEAGKLVRLRERDGVVGRDDVLTLVNDVEPGKCCHTGGKIAFDHEKQLVLTIGDQGDEDRRDAQKPGKFNGKVIRFDPNSLAQYTRPGSKKIDEPQRVTIASGLRNPYGLDIHPRTGVPYLTDNGPDGCDEINAVFEDGANFGNPEAECTARDPRFVDPIWDSGPSRLAPTGMRFYQGDMFPQFEDDLLWCAFNTGEMFRMRLVPPKYDRFDVHEVVLPSGANGGNDCRMDVAVAPDGSIYYASATSISRISR